MNKERRWSFQKKAEVGEKMINEPGVAVKSGLPAAWRKIAYKPPVGGKRRAPPGTVARLTEAWAAKEEAQKKQKRTASSLKILLS
jgi:hypothetical protein